MKKKKREKRCRNWLCYCPIFFCIGTGSRYNYLYRDTEAGRLAWPGGGSHVTIQTLYHGWGGLNEWKSVSRYTVLYRDMGAVLGMQFGWERVMIHLVVS